MNLDRLRAVQAEEREADSLRALPDAFYKEVADYLESLREQRSEAAAGADDPFGAEEVRELTDEIEAVEEVIEAIYERRVGKLVKRASLAAAGMPADDEGLTTEEAELFRDMVAQIEDHRETVLASFGRGGGRKGAVGTGAANDAPPVDDDPGANSPDDGPELDASDAMGGGPDESGSESDVPPPPPDEPVEDEGVDADVSGLGPEADEPDPDAEGSTDGGSESETERVTVRIKQEVGEVFGVDERVYDLASEDVVTLPAANAKPLLDRDAAEKVD